VLGFYWKEHLEKIIYTPLSAIAQSFGFDPETTTLMMRWFGLGKVGKSTFLMVTLVPGKMNASFILNFG
jgi:hypothetical protein